METFPAFRVAGSHNFNVTEDSTRLDFLLNTRVVEWLRYLDFALLGIITAYMFTHFIICPDKKQFLSFIYVSSIFGVFCQWLPVTTDVFVSPLPEWFARNSFLQGIKVLRILPVFALLRPYKSMYILGQALLQSRKELTLLGILIFMSSVMFGYLIFVFEIVEVNTHFRSIPDGFWWGVITLTTVGYGDMFPQSPAGKMVGVACAVVGILVVALPVPIISGNFTKIYDLVEVAEYHRTLMGESDISTENTSTHKKY